MLKEKGFYKGINFGGWLSQCDYSEEHMNNFIKDEDYAVAASWGADHIRIPFDYNILENNDGSFNENGFARIDKAVENCPKTVLILSLTFTKLPVFHSTTILKVKAVSLTVQSIRKDSTVCGRKWLAAMEKCLKM